MKKGHNRTGGIASEQLNSIVVRVERLEEEKAGIAADIRDVYAEAKGNGFDPKTIRHIIKLRKMDQQEREEHEALVDIYKAALGMLDGTPLGEAAIRRLSKDESDEPEANHQRSNDGEDERKPEHQNLHPGVDVEKAREMARKAAAENRPVTDNPFTARDPRRAAWDEEWCKAAGSDGMELPEAWRRAVKKPESEKKGG